MDSTTGASPRQLGRIAGALYLINVVCGAFAIGYVQATLLASDPATTAVNIQAHELLYRTGLAAHVLVTRDQRPLGVDLLRAVQGGEPEGCPAYRVLHPGRDRHRGRWPAQSVRAVGKNIGGAVHPLLSAFLDGR
jgi:uncharacterized protein DUF4386